MVTTAPHPDPRPDQEDQPDQQETARAPKRGTGPLGAAKASPSSY